MEDIENANVDVDYRKNRRDFLIERPGGLRSLDYWFFLLYNYIIKK